MSKRIVSLRIKNFKCFDNSRFYEFSIEFVDNLFILSGPNGFGKTTFFDAIEIIFSNQITRLEKQIEHKRTNLGKNLLLNESGANGYIILTLQDENSNYITLMGKILKDNHNIDIEKSVVYGVKNEFVKTEELDLVLNKYNEWNEELKSNLRYKKDDFNVYYYISQAESVHFLKRSIQDRKNIMSVLLRTDLIDKKRETVINLIGKNITASSPINDLIKSVDKDIDGLVQECKKLIGRNSSVNKINDDVQLNLYLENNELFFWDNPEIDKTEVENIKSAAKDVERIYYYYSNQKDFYSKKRNDEIESLNTYEVLRDYKLCRKYIKAGKVSVEDINNAIKILDRKIQVFNISKFFTTEKPSASLYCEKDISKLKELIPELNKIDFSLIGTLSREIIETEKSISNSQNIITAIEEARNSLKNASQNYVGKDGYMHICPYCNTKFNSDKELNDGFAKVTLMLKEEGGIAMQRILQRKEELFRETRKIYGIIAQYIGVVDNNVDFLNSQKTDYQRIVADCGRIQKVEKLIAYLEKSDFNKEVSDEGLETEIQRALSNMLSGIVNPEFYRLLEQYDFYGLAKKYGDTINQLINTVSCKKLLQKRDYLLWLASEKNNAELVAYKEKIKALIVKKKKLTIARERLNNLGKIYDFKLDEYKKLTLKKLRIPLLIYTSKILQDYQNGLGVFIDKDEMRFISNGDAKHDILNTFSSGQLSGFVMAFLFAMNKQYINKDSDDFGFILIDDPVQTMDDINIASLIEVMRNDFSDKQIILSTHEVDKENYILYKFYKYNLIGQSFNVKENMYDNRVC